MVDKIRSNITVLDICTMFEAVQSIYERVNNVRGTENHI